MINILYSLKLRNCSKTPKANQTKKLSPPPPTKTKSTSFICMELTTLKYSEKFKNYTDEAALFILFDSCIVSRLETSSVLKK